MWKFLHVSETSLFSVYVFFFWIITARARPSHGNVLDLCERIRSVTQRIDETVIQRERAKHEQAERAL